MKVVSLVRWLLAVAAIVCGAGCEPPASRIIFVVPDGFRGVFKIKEDRNSAQQIPLQNGVFVYRIPTNGMLVASTTGPLRRVVEETASYYSGAKLECQFNVRPVLGPPFQEVVRIHSCGVDSDGWFYFFVGTEAEAFELGRSPDSVRKIGTLKGKK